MSLTEYRYSFNAMGSPCELRLYSQSEDPATDIAERLKAEVLRLEARYSRFRDDSITSRINRSAGSGLIEVDDETAGLLDYAQTAWEQSSGLFDITSGILRKAWNFKSGRLPSQDSLDELLSLVGWEQVGWDSPELLLPRAGMELDFGGYVKEYSVDALVRMARESGISHGMVDLGGDIGIIGDHPDGSPWQVGIRHPRAPETAITRVGLKMGCLASSGDYERFMEVDGRRYCHILNPKTGWPSQGLAAVSVAAPLCLIAGTASTIAMLKGREEGPAWLEELGLPHVWVTAAGEMGGTGIRQTV